MLVYYAALGGKGTNMPLQDLKILGSTVLKYITAGTEISGKMTAKL